MQNKVKPIAVCILAIFVLVITQTMAFLLGELTLKFGVSEVMEALVTAVMYPILTFAGLKLVLEKWCKYSLRTMRIKKLKIKWYWVLTAVLLPLLVIALFQSVEGTWIAMDADIAEKTMIAAWGILVYSLAAGIVEEMVFRGVIMGILEQTYNEYVAMFCPSVVFGLIHVLNGPLSIESTIQLGIAGTIVGIMFSLIAYQSDNFWNSATVHAFWNMSTIGLCHIGLNSSEDSLLTYVIDTKCSIVSGGDFGIEASAFSVIGYAIVCFIALLLIKEKQRVR